MKIGLLMPFTGYTANPAPFSRTARVIGFESVDSLSIRFCQ